MNKWLSVELSLLLLVSLVAGVGLFSLGGSANVDDSTINDLSGFQTASPSTTSTGLYNGLGQKVINFGTLKSVEHLTGQTCFYHKKTGDYYRFQIAGYTDSPYPNQMLFVKEYPSPSGWFGGKGGKCQQINLDLKGTPLVSKISISGVPVKGRPNAYNNKFDVVFAQPSKPDLSKITGTSDGFTFFVYDDIMGISLTKELRSLGFTGSVGSGVFSNVAFTFNFMRNFPQNLIFLSRDGSKRIITNSKNVYPDDVRRIDELSSYYSSLPNVVVEKYPSLEQVPLVKFLELNK